MKLFPNIYSLNPEKSLTTRDLMVEKFSSPEKMEKENWFADMSLSLAERRAQVLKGSSIATLQVESAGPNDSIPEACLQRLLRRAGCLGEYKEVYDDMRGAVEILLNRIISAIPHACRASTQGVVCDDVLAGLSKCRLGCGLRMYPSSLYGFGGPRGFRYVWSSGIANVLHQVHPGLYLCGGAASVICYMLSEVLRTLLVLAAEAADPLLKFKCQQVMECTAGPKLDKGKLDPTCKVQIYVIKDGPVNGPDTGSKKVLTVDDVIQAIIVAVPGELRPHALQEGRKAVLRFRDRDDADLFKRSGLQFHPEHVALFAQRTEVPVQQLDIEACVLLTAVVEYFCAEILEVHLMLNLFSFHRFLIAFCCSCLEMSKKMALTVTISTML